MTKDAKSESYARLGAESVSVVFMGLVVAAANGFQLAFILFPELGALSSDVLLRPAGKWAKEPWKLIATPTATAIIGILVGTYLPFGLPSILLAMTAGIGIVFALRSNVAPAISAGVLPIVLGVTSWLYPLCILGTLTALAALLLVWRRMPAGRLLLPVLSPEGKTVEILESPPRGTWSLPALYGFVIVVGTIAQITGWRFILFPPLIVIAYEMLGHPDTCPWAKPPFVFPIVCFLSALAGVQADRWWGVNPFAAGVVLVGSFAMLRLFRLRMPPVLAIGLIPFVMPSPTYIYALSVGLGTGALTGWFLAYRAVLDRDLSVTSASNL